MESKLLSQIKWLRIYSIFLSLSVLSLILFSFKENGKKKFTEIDVEKINIVEKDGRVKMVIGNKESLPNPVTNGRVLYEAKERGPGFIVFNDDGDECGGYVFRNDGAILTMDQYKQDLIVYMQVQNDKKGKPLRAGFWVAPKSNNVSSDVMDQKLDSIDTISDKQQQKKAAEEFWKTVDLHNKAFMGKTREDNTGLFLFDKDFKVRLMAFVDTLGNPKLQFLDDKGKVIYSLPQ